MRSKILVVMSHKLNQSQVQGLNDINLTPISLADINSDLANQCKSINPNASSSEIQNIADGVVETAQSLGVTHLMLQGEPSLFFAAVTTAKASGINCLISTTERVSVEKVQDDGSVVKTNVFKHVQFREL